MTETMSNDPMLPAALTNRFEVTHLLGTGSHADVWRAEDGTRRRPVALKVFHALDDHTTNAMLDILKRAGKLAHPHIVRILESGMADGQVYVAMRYVSGGTLRDRIVGDLRVPLREAIGIARDVAAAIDFGRRYGVVHGAIKPENILLEGSRALVSDFGLGSVLPWTDAFDRNDDIAALGSLLYEMLTGAPPATPFPPGLAVHAGSVDAPAREQTLVAVIPHAMMALIAESLDPVSAARVWTPREFAEALGDGRLPIGGRRGAHTAPAAA